MSSSDSLKKKVCVTVFLDELFEEVIDEDQRDFNPIYESEVNIVQKVYEKPTQVSIKTEEKHTLGTITNNDLLNGRPRKHRKTSKFSNNVSVSNKVSKHDVGTVKSQPKTNKNFKNLYDLKKIRVDYSSTSFTELSEFDLSNDSFLTVDPAYSSFHYSSDEIKPRKKFFEQGRPNTQKNSKSIQTEGIEKPSNAHSNDVVQKPSANPSQKRSPPPGDFDRNCRSRDKNLTEGDCIPSYNLKTILEECLKSEKNNILKTEDSYCQTYCKENVDLKNCKSILGGSDASTQCRIKEQHPLREDSLMCYSVCLKCKESFDNRKTIEHVRDRVKSTSRDNVKPSKSRKVQSVNRANKKDDKEKNKTKNAPVEVSVKKNYAEGDILSKLNVNDKSSLGEKETQKHNLNKEPEKKSKNILKTSLHIFSSRKDLAKIIYKSNQCGQLQKILTDSESEMVFAESQNLPVTSTLSSVEGPKNNKSLHDNICVLQFEDKISHSNILRRMKTVEILGDNSLNDMKTLSTEVILVCENLSDQEVSLETWQSNASLLKSLTEMGQCYLKDSKDSALYLLEIPLHFVNTKKAKT